MEFRLLSSEPEEKKKEVQTAVGGSLILLFRKNPVIVASPGFLSSWEASRVLEWSTLFVLENEKIETVQVWKHFDLREKIKYVWLFLLLVVSFPEFHRTDVGSDEDGTAQEGVEWSGEDCRHDGLDKQHGGVWRGAGQGSSRRKLLCN